MADRIPVHVLSRADGWSVVREGRERATSVHPTQAEAARAGREIARKDEAEFLLHARNGRVRDRSDYGGDPGRPSASPEDASTPPTEDTAGAAARVTDGMVDLAPESELAAEDEIRVQRSEEELVAGTREREAGSTKIRKRVRTERERLEVPVRREEVRVERVPVPEETTGAEIGEEEVVMPVTETEIVVSKRPVVKEEIRVHKDVVEGTEVVEDDVRREEIDVLDETDRRKEGQKPKRSSQDKTEGAIDKVTGHAKEAGGSLTGDKDKKAEGLADQDKGILKKKGADKDLLK